MKTLFSDLSSVDGRWFSCTKLVSLEIATNDFDSLKNPEKFKLFSKLKLLRRLKLTANKLEVIPVGIFCIFRICLGRLFSCVGLKKIPHFYLFSIKFGIHCRLTVSSISILATID